MATVTTNHGTYSGRTVESIIRREYGRKAHLLGCNIVTSDQHGHHVLGRVIDCEGRSEAAEAYDQQMADAVEAGFIEAAR